MNCQSGIFRTRGNRLGLILVPLRLITLYNYKTTLNMYRCRAYSPAVVFRFSFREATKRISPDRYSIKVVVLHYYTADLRVQSIYRGPMPVIC